MPSRWYPGVHQAAAPLGALRGRFLNVLITDEATAREILRLHPGGAYPMTEEQIVQDDRPGSGGPDSGAPRLACPLNVSARHIHLSQDARRSALRAGHQLTKMKDLMQPGQFAYARDGGGDRAQG